MSKKYKECMEYLVYQIYDAYDKKDPMHVMKAQFDTKEDAEIFVYHKTKRADCKLQIIKNDGFTVIA